MALVDLLAERLPDGLERGGEQERFAKALLEDAAAIVADASGWDVAEVGQWPHIGQIIVVNMAKRVLTNPEGKTYEQIGPYAYSRDRESVAGGIWMTKQEAKWLAKKTGKPAVTSIGVSRPRTPRVFRGEWAK